MTLHFFTFLVDINRHSKQNLVDCLKILVNSLNNQLSDFELIVFTNFNPPQLDKNVIYRKYYDNTKHLIYNDKWLNLSFNKINIYKDLYDETNINYIWIDLDTIITYDISYLNNLNNFFIINGGNTLTKQNIFNNYPLKIDTKDYIQGNFWKLDIQLYHELMKTFKEINERGLELEYDLQCLFNYHINIKENLNGVNLIGKNCFTNTLNGLGIWTNDGKDKHGNLQGLEQLYYDTNGILRTKYYPDKEIHLISFTFFTIKELWNHPTFKKIVLGS